MSDFLSSMLEDEGDESEHPSALTIAGSDSGGGAGIQADLKTFAACGIHGTSVVTLVTAQNTQSVSGIEMLPEPIIHQQFQAVVEDIPPLATKTGALGNERVIEVVADLLRERPLDNLVVDPVMISKHGDPLLPEPAQRLFRDRMLEGVDLVTPNRHEAEALSDQTVGNVDSMKEAAKCIFDFGPKNVVIKGSHFDEIVRDIFYDGTGFIEYGADRIRSNRVHGSGCVYSSAITARLALGDDLPEALGFAREFINGAIEKAPLIGEGMPPVHPMFDHWT
ncbi:MAG: bifunctional hydroxymethylpyrimidine kinase/phosphomethylpyrimidine kinase [Persicimonas sp.]